MDDRDEADKPDDAKIWHARLALAAKEEEDWRDIAQKIVDRYRDEERDESSTKLNIFAANVNLLQPNVYSASPVADVRRRNVLEDSALAGIGGAVAVVLEKALSYCIDDAPFDTAMEAVRDDMLIVGRGVAREVYEVDIVRRNDVQVVEQPAPMAPVLTAFGQPMLDAFGQPALVPAGPAPPPVYLLDGVEIVPEFEGEDEDRKPFLEQKADERVETRYVFWSDFRMEPARRWEDVGWVAFRHAMDRSALRAEFGAKGDKIPLTISARSGDSDHTTAEGKSPPDPPSRADKGEVWEIWDRSKRERVWVAKDFQEILRKEPDPLKLKDFYPCPCPLYSVTTTDQMVPRPEFCLYQDQAGELDEIQTRIRALVTVLKAVVVVDGDLAEIIDIAKAKDGDAIPLGTPGGVAEDMNARIWWWPVERIIQVIGTLQQRAEQLKMQIFELTGIHDLQRGASKERETAAAQRLKGQYGQVRMTPRALPMARFVRDCLRIKAEIMAEMFDPGTLERIGGKTVTPEMIALMREEKLRNTNIAVATDSTVKPDMHAEREDATEFMAASNSLLEQVAAVAQAMPAVVPLMMESYRQTIRTFRFARNLEPMIDQTVQMITQQVQQMLAQQQMQQQQMAMEQQMQQAQMAGANGAMPPQQPPTGMQ
jgi:hypothetical protein